MTTVSTLSKTEMPCLKGFTRLQRIGNRAESSTGMVLTLTWKTLLISAPYFYCQPENRRILTSFKKILATLRGFG